MHKRFGVADHNIERTKRRSPIVGNIIAGNSVSFSKEILLMASPIAVALKFPHAGSSVRLSL